MDRGKRKAAVKKVIAAMTVGKDVSMLFPDVVNCMQTEDLELKKLVYLYLINYAKTQPDLAIMAVNTFVRCGAWHFGMSAAGWLLALLATTLPLLRCPCWCADVCRFATQDPSICTAGTRPSPTR